VKSEEGEIGVYRVKREEGELRFAG